MCAQCVTETTVTHGVYTAHASTVMLMAMCRSQPCDQPSWLAESCSVLFFCRSQSSAHKSPASPHSVPHMALLLAPPHNHCSTAAHQSAGLRPVRRCLLRQQQSNPWIVPVTFLRQLLVLQQPCQQASRQLSLARPLKTVLRLQARKATVWSCLTDHQASQGFLHAQ